MSEPKAWKEPCLLQTDATVLRNFFSSSVGIFNEFCCCASFNSSSSIKLTEMFLVCRRLHSSEAIGHKGVVGGGFLPHSPAAWPLEALRGLRPLKDQPWKGPGLSNSRARTPGRLEILIGANFEQNVSWKFSHIHGCSGDLVDHCAVLFPCVISLLCFWDHFIFLNHFSAALFTWAYKRWSLKIAFIFNYRNV